MGHLRLWRQRTASQAHVASGESDWLVPVRSVGQAAKPRFLVQPAGGAAYFGRVRLVLYLINASGNLTDVAYLDAELKVLDLIGKPVVVLLNQVGGIQKAK